MRSPVFEHPVASAPKRSTTASDGADDAPQRCPSCASTTIVATSKVVTSQTYWRCDACGEVWSPARRMTHLPRGWRA